MFDIHWHEAAFIALLLSTAPLSVFLLSYLYRRHRFYDYPLMLLVAGGGWWATCYGIGLLTPGFQDKMHILTWEYVGIVLVPPAWFLLGLQLNDQLQRIKPWMLAIIFCPAIITLVQVQMWQHWDLYWTSLKLVHFGNLSAIDVERGPAYWINIIYAYALQLAGAILILTSLFRSNRFYLQQRLALAISLILPWASNAIYVFNLSDLRLDFTPLSIVIAALLLIIGVLRYGLGDLVPVAREKVFSQMKEGVMLFDDQRRLIDANEAALRLFGQEGTATGRPAMELFARHPELQKLLDPDNETRELLYSGLGGPWRVTSEDLSPEPRFQCQLLVFTDLTLGNRIETILRLVTESTSGDTGDEFYRSLTRSLALALGVRYAFVGVMNTSKPETIKTLAFWNGNGFRENATFDLADTASEKLLIERVCVLPNRAGDTFPQDKLLGNLGIECYIGVRLTNFAGDIIGNLVIMHDEPVKNVDACAAVLEVFAIRAAAELERQHNEALLKESEARYRRIVETTRDGVCVIDAAGNIEFLNTPMADMLGGNKSSLEARPLAEHLAIADDEPDALSFRNETVTVQIENALSRSLWVTISKTVIPGEDDAPAGMLLIFSDITEAHSLEEHKARIELQLQHAQKLESLGVLAGGIAHDFNNLLMPILGYLDLIQDRTSNDGTVQDYLGRMRDAGGKLADLCNQMLTYSGRGQFIKRTLDLNDALSRLNDLVRASISKNIELEFNLAPGLPFVNVDETQLDQVVINLAINASESMAQQNSGKILIRTGEASLDATALKGLSNGDAITPGHYVFLEVIDEGSGIAERDIARLFEPFYTTKFTGRGLGMAVVFGIIKGHQGAISVESTPRAGTRIRIYFPASEIKPEGKETPRQALVRNKAKGTLLVVDDEEMVRTIVTSMLESIGYDVIPARNGREGLKLFHAYESALAGAVIDVTMPELDGYSLVAGIRKSSVALPIVLVSGFHAREFEEKQLGYSNVSFLQKPFEIADLVNALETSSNVPGNLA